MILRFFAVIGVLTLIGLMQACFSDSNASGGNNTATTDTYTKAEIDQMFADLRSEISPGDRVTAGSGATGGAPGAFSKTSAATQDLGTLLGYIPSDVPVYKSTLFSIKSPNGYLYSVPNNRGGTNGYVAIRQESGIYYETADCSGQGYTSDFVTEYGATQGVVFRIGAGQYNEIVDDPNQYFMVTAGADRYTYTAQSRMTKVGTCESTASLPSNGFSGFAVAPNDPAVSGVESAVIPTPIQIAQ